MAASAATLLHNITLDLPLEWRLLRARNDQSLALGVGSLRCHTQDHLDVAGCLAGVRLLHRQGKAPLEFLVAFHLLAHLALELLHLPGPFACDHVQGYELASHTRVERSKYRKYSSSHIEAGLCLFIAILAKKAD